MTAEPLPPRSTVDGASSRGQSDVDGWHRGSTGLSGRRFRSDRSGVDGGDTRPLSDVDGAVAVAERGLPARWPPAWPSLRGRFLQRLAFVALVDLLTGVGLAVIGGLRGQWWALLPALVLLTGPALALARARRRAERAAAAGRLVLAPGGAVYATPGRRPLARLDPDGTVHYLR